MTVHKSYKIELKLNNKQRTLCIKAAGCARFAYNWGLATKIDEYEKTGNNPGAFELHKRLVVLKKTEFPWLSEVSAKVPIQALRDLDSAYRNFFRRVKKGTEKPGFPRFKSKSGGVGSFRLYQNIHMEQKRIKLPRLGWLRLKECDYIPTDQRIVSATVSERAGRWFVSVNIEHADYQPPKHMGLAVGVDVGIRTLAVTSKDEQFDNPQALRKHEKKLARLHRSLSRKNKGSNNRMKAVKSLAKHYFKISNMRKDSAHKASDSITKNYSLIGVEKLNVAGMIKNRHLSKSMSDAGFGELIRQIKYKAEWRGGRVVEADRFYPSSKTCSRCGNVKGKLSPSERTYECAVCGLSIDRDLNAAINLENIASSARINACGDGKITEPSGSVAVAETGSKQRMAAEVLQNEEATQ